MDDAEIPDDLPTNGDQRTFETESAGRPPSIAIVEAIAAIEGVQSPDVEFTLYESIDPEALDSLFAERETDEGTATDDIVAEFRIDDYTVKVTSDGTITVEAPENAD